MVKKSMKVNVREVEIHFQNTKKLAENLNPKEVSKWLLKEGYYPESYVLPPFFRVNKFSLENTQFFKPKKKKNTDKYKNEYKPCQSELKTVSFPKSDLTDREFGVCEPRLYHDVCFILEKNWKLIIKKIFRKTSIFSFSFPIPVDETSLGKLGDKRSERMIYEYIEMAEKKLLIDSISYKYVVHIDIKNFYPSIYTHSISWALHKKDKIRKKGNRDNFRFLGNILDKLFQSANDGCTNGIPIGPVVSDLVCEILLSAIDSNVKLPKYCFGVRFKDDYRILCNTEDEGKIIIKKLQKELQKYNLHLNEEKTKLENLPDGLFRSWIIDFDNFYTSIDSGKEFLNYKQFQIIALKVNEINKKYINKGVTEKFLGKLLNAELNLRVKLNNLDETKKFITLLWGFSNNKVKCIGQVLGIFEILINKDDRMKKYIQDLVNIKFKDKDNGEFVICWLYYFMKTNNLNIPKIKHSGKFISSLKENKNNVYSGYNDLVRDINTVKVKHGNINKNITLFQKNVLSFKVVV